MTNEQMDAEIAIGIMGWELCDRLLRWCPKGPNVTLADTRGKREWSPSTDLRHAAEAEARLTGEQRVKYGYALAEELRLDLDMNGADAFALATATPAQRSAALLAVLKGGK